MKDLEQLRARLPARRDVTYLNTGTLGVMAEPVLERYVEALQRVERFGRARWDEVRAIAEVARQRPAELVGACSEELAFTGNSTDGLALVLASLRWSPSDRVLTSDQEHPALLLPLSAVSRRHEVSVHQFTVGSTPEETIVSFAERLEEVRPRLVAFSHVSCETGVRLPVERLVSMAHQHGALVLLDVAQSVGQCRVDLRGLGVDFAAGNGHKWLHGPKGTGFLFVRRDMLALLEPPLVGDGAVEPAFERTADWLEGWRFRSDAQRFEFGTRNPAPWIGLTAAIDYLEAIGWDTIERHQCVLVRWLHERISAIPGVRWYSTLDPTCGSGMVTLGLSGWDGETLSRVLWERFQIIQRRVLVPNGIRVSCAYFTAFEDLEKLASALEQLAVGSAGVRE